LCSLKRKNRKRKKRRMNNQPNQGRSFCQFRVGAFLCINRFI
jgi:hypothetical protein